MSYHYLRQKILVLRVGFRSQSSRCLALSWTCPQRIIRRLRVELSVLIALSMIYYALSALIRLGIRAPCSLLLSSRLVCRTLDCQNYITNNVNDSRLEPSSSTVSVAVCAPLSDSHCDNEPLDATSSIVGPVPRRPRTSPPDVCVVARDLLSDVVQDVDSLNASVSIVGLEPSKVTTSINLGD